MAERQTTNSLVPMIDCFVALLGHRNRLGRVVALRTESDGSYVEVQWGVDGAKAWHEVTELRNGFRPGHIVQDVPRSNTRMTLGTGTVLTERRIAERDMVLVQWHGTGESRWLPYEKLVRLRDAKIKYERAESPETDCADRFRLKASAYALESWNQITGALDRVDIDPLPHQVDLVHRIMTSDQSNWLIADDVGLGKTIEVGLLLAAMKRRRQGRRVLIVCPAGVVRQWQDEMQYKFSEDYRIYGMDFNIYQPSHWRSFDRVIASIDRAKTDVHGPIFSESGNWDVIVFDEAHHLSKIEHQPVTQRYQLAERLQKQTDSLLFLTGTPHQGKTHQFVNLLMLLRPDLARRFEHVFSDPSVVAEVVLRNRKSLVTDANGNFIFRGQDTSLVDVPMSDRALQFDRQLQDYLRLGYSAAAEGGTTGRAIGFVMTTYRKLASSSIAAIEKALERRRERLLGHSSTNRITETEFGEIYEFVEEGSDQQDDLEDLSDQIAGSFAGANPFFDDEQRQISDLLTVAKEVRSEDLKLKQFLDHIVDPLCSEGKRLLIFTEYRATQGYLAESLRFRYPKAGICQINGSMTLSAKRENIARFNDSAQFLISTEAGGEGINLHENCHILVNYDLPWNPSRLVQRAGRLYRYGQQERVIVFNLMARDGFDNMTLSMMLDRVYNIASDMAGVSAEYVEGIETEIIGELLERVDVASILARNKTMDLHRSDQDVDEAIMRAMEAKSQQEALFSRVEGYDPDAGAALYSFGREEVLSFLEGILPIVGVSIRSRMYGGRVLELELPEEMRGRYSEFPERATVVRITIDRQLAVRVPNLVPMDFASVFFTDLIERAKSPEFKGEYACIQGQQNGTLGLFRIRWQNDQGVPRWEALLPIFIAAGTNAPHVNPQLFASILSESAIAPGDPPATSPHERRELLDMLHECAEDELAARCTTLRHPNDVVLLAAVDVVAARDNEDLC